MANKNKLPSDAYSADEFRGSLTSLQESGVDYVPPSHERGGDEGWEVVSGALTDEERATVRRLDQLYANAHREALLEDERRTRKVIVPTVLKALRAMENDAHVTMERLGGGSARVAHVARDFLNEVRGAQKMLEDGGVAEVRAVAEVYSGLREAHGELRRLAGSLVHSDRFGNDKLGPLEGSPT